MMNAAFDASSAILRQVVNPALRSVLLAGAVGLVLSAFRVKSTLLRLFAWTAVLYAALAMPLLGWVLPPVSLAAPVFLGGTSAPGGAYLSRSTTAPTSTTNYAHTANRKPANSVLSDETAQIPLESAVGAAKTGAAHRTSDWPSIPWTSLATGIYFAGALLLLIRFVIGLFFSRRLIRASRTIPDHRVRMRVASRACAWSLDSVPHAAESELISVPLTIGAVRSTILLPTNWREWDDAKLDAVIAHEVSHIVRRDALMQRISLLHRAIFWFSPLAWWLDRHLAELAEQASDEAALFGGADRNDYAKTLLGFFEALHATPGRVWWQGVSMAKNGADEQRLERILAWKGSVTMGLKKSIVLAIIALGAPAVYLAASVRPADANLHAQEGGHEQGAMQPSTPQATSTPTTPPAPNDLSEPPLASAPPNSVMTPPSAPATGVISSGGRLWAPVASESPVPSAPWAYRSEEKHGHRYSYSYGYDDEQRFVIVTGSSDSFMMSGTGEDARHAEKLKKQIPGDFIWFERDEKSYIIRDQATIDRARKLWAPQEELGKKQEDLGKQQDALGKQQEELGRRMEQIKVNVPDMTAELDRLKAKLQKLGPSATAEQLGDLQSEIGDLQSKIGEIQSQAGEQQSKLGEQMGALGEKQGQLGEQQGELGRQQGELAEKASREMKDLLDEAIKKGTAQPEPQTGGKGML